MGGILFLDRDGVLDAKAPEGRYVASLDELRVLPGVPAALARLRGDLPEVPFVVVTNQRGVALGVVSAATVDAINERLRDQVRAAGGDIDRFEVCPHDLGVCDCRKPGLGMFRRALAAYPDARADQSVMVGDSLSDLEAGTTLGAKVALVGGSARRTGVLAAAARSGIQVHAIADGLPELVEQGVLQAWLADPVGVGR